MHRHRHVPTYTQCEQKKGENKGWIEGVSKKEKGRKKGRKREGRERKGRNRGLVRWFRR